MRKYAPAPILPPKQFWPISCPKPGYYRMKLIRGGHPVGVRVWFGPPLDPVTREELDRSPRWQATANGQDIDLDRVWPQCLNDPIHKSEHDRLQRLHNWASAHVPDAPQANPTNRIDILKAPLPF